MVRNRRKRRGTAVVEAAVCLPVIVLLVFASIECCSMIFLDQALYVASYEGIRKAVHPHATNEEVIERCNEILVARDVAGVTCTLDPADIEGLDRGVNISVTVSAPCDDNRIMPSWFFGGRVLSTSITMVKE